MVSGGERLDTLDAENLDRRFENVPTMPAVRMRFAVRADGQSIAVTQIMRIGGETVCPRRYLLRSAAVMFGLHKRQQCLGRLATNLDNAVLAVLIR